MIVFLDPDRLRRAFRRAGEPPLELETPAEIALRWARRMFWTVVAVIVAAVCWHDSLGWPLTLLFAALVVIGRALMFK